MLQNLADRGGAADNRAHLDDDALEVKNCHNAVEAYREALANGYPAKRRAAPGAGIGSTHLLRPLRRSDARHSGQARPAARPYDRAAVYPALCVDGPADCGVAILPVVRSLEGEGEAAATAASAMIIIVSPPRPHSGGRQTWLSRRDVRLSAAPRRAAMGMTDRHSWIDGVEPRKDEVRRPLPL